MIADNLVALVCKNIYINLSKYSQTHTKTFVNDSVVIVLKFKDYHLCAATSLVFLSQIEENFEI